MTPETLLSELENLAADVGLKVVKIPSRGCERASPLRPAGCARCGGDAGCCSRWGNLRSRAVRYWLTLCESTAQMPSSSGICRPLFATSWVLDFHFKNNYLKDFLCGLDGS